VAKRVAIVQSCYIPWKGYFDLIASVDEFILFDTVQFTRRDWRNRNRIKTREGPRWLTIPVTIKGKYTQTVAETRIADPGWRLKHFEIIRHNYARAPHFRDYRDWLANLYESARSLSLSEVNYTFTRAICSELGIGTKLSWSSDYPSSTGKNERLISLCRAAGATHYLSGPSAKAYLDPAMFQAAGIGLEFKNYESYPEYPQLFPPFVHEVSVLDVILNVGPRARDYIRARAYV
jgi:hypothetical protein